MNYLIFDGNLALHKNYHIYKNLSSKLDGETIRTGVPYGMVRMILRLAEMYEPCHVAIVFDNSVRISNFSQPVRPTPIRMSCFPEYKSGRESPDEGLLEGVKHLKPFLTSMSLSIFESDPLFEADDVVAFVVKACCIRMIKKEQCGRVVIVSDDKDFYQLIRKKHGYEVVMHARSDVVYDMTSWKKKFQFPPRMFVDYLALTGDTVDGIPGVKGIGPKTAAKLVSEGPPYFDDNDPNWEVLERNRKLITLHAVPSSCNVCMTSHYNKAKFEAVARKYCMFSFLREREQHTLSVMKGMKFIKKE